jgi:hypothetical protein
MFVKGVTTVSKAWRLILSGKNAEVGIKCIESLDEFLMGSASLVFGSESSPLRHAGPRPPHRLSNTHARTISGLVRAVHS